MKKFLFAAIMLVSFTAFSNAQQKGVGINTTTPASTLDVVADAAMATMPDGVLVPRMTLTVLKGKDGAYLAAQNGALIFVTDFSGGTTAKTANVTAVGFYYYDAPNSVWVAVGGGAAATPQRYEAIRGTVTTVTASSYTVLPNDFFIVTNASTAVTVTFPALTAADAGRVVYIFNNNTTTAINGLNNVVGNISVAQFRGFPVVWSGTQWFTLTK